MAELEYRTYTGPERRARDRSLGIELRRRRDEPVEVERRQTVTEGFDIASVLEMHLDQCKTRRAMVQLLERWLAEARKAEQDVQDPDYIAAVERAMGTMKNAPDVETGIAMLQRREHA